MLHYSEQQLGPSGSSVDNASGFEPIALDRILAVLRRQALVIAACAAAGLALGLTYVVLAVPLYTSSTDILIDRGQAQVVNVPLPGTDVLQGDSEMTTLVELLKSDQLARSVATNLKLYENTTHMAGDPSLIGTVREGFSALFSLLFTWAPDQEPLLSTGATTDKIAAAAALLRVNVSVERIEKTFVLRLSYTSSDPRLANDIATAYGAAYLTDQLQAKYDSTRLASEWLRDRIAELKQQSYDADLAVQNFRNANGLLSTGTQLVSEQQLGELNTQLITAQANTAEAKARLDQIRTIIESGRTDAVVNDALASSTINALRQQYLGAARRETEIVQSLGPNHPQAVRLRDEMKESQRLIFEELRRIADSYESTYNVAVKREESLRESLAGVTGENVSANTSSVQLRELEREADTFRNLYNTFLQRYQETIQQQSFPIAEARIITEAKVPKRPSFPRKPIILALSLILGAFSGVGLAAVREHRDRFFRTGHQVRSELGTEYLGAVGIFKPEDDADELSTGARPVKRLWRPGNFSGHVLNHPMSNFAETLRNVRLAADAQLVEKSSKVIGVISCLPGEGKTTISANLATLLAMRDCRVALVDADLRNPGLTRSLADKSEVGIVEAVRGSAAVADCLVWDGTDHLAVLPVAHGTRVFHSSDILASAGMGSLLEQLRASFEYVVIDLPPIGPVIDARAVAHRIDGFVFIVEWGSTPRKLVQTLMTENPVFREKCLGIVLNNADESRMRLYRTADSADFYTPRYQNYYHSTGTRT